MESNYFEEVVDEGGNVSPWSDNSTTGKNDKEYIDKECKRDTRVASTELPFSIKGTSTESEGVRGGPAGTDSLEYLATITVMKNHPPKLAVHSIPLGEMIDLMKTYGPECNKERNRNKTTITEASIRRKFARWFPDFFTYFRYNCWTGKCEPILGVTQEQKRRMQKRKISEARRLRSNKGVPMSKLYGAHQLGNDKTGLQSRKGPPSDLATHTIITLLRHDLSEIRNRVPHLPHIWQHIIAIIIISFTR